MVHIEGNYYNAPPEDVIITPLDKGKVYINRLESWCNYFDINIHDILSGEFKGF